MLMMPTRELTARKNGLEIPKLLLSQEFLIVGM
jgi:hypothetical protein